MIRVSVEKQNRIRSQQIIDSQTVGEKVYSQEGNSPDHKLKS